MHAVDGIKVLNDGYCLVEPDAIHRGRTFKALQNVDKIMRTSLFLQMRHAFMFDCKAILAAHALQWSKIKYPCSNCAVQSDVFGHDAESAELRANVQRELRGLFCL